MKVYVIFVSVSRNSCDLTNLELPRPPIGVIVVGVIVDINAKLYISEI